MRNLQKSIKDVTTKSHSVKDCNPCTDTNTMTYGHIVVSTYEELYNFPCKLRVDGMVVTVVEAGYSEFQLQVDDEGSKCDNSNWVITGTGEGFKENFRINFDRSSVEAELEEQVKEGVIYYIQEEDTYWRVDEENNLVELFPPARTEEFVVTNGGNILDYGSTFPGNMTLAEAMRFVFTKIYYPVFTDASISFAPLPSVVEVGNTITFSLSVQSSHGQYRGKLVNGLWNSNTIQVAAYANSERAVINGEPADTINDGKYMNRYKVLPSNVFTASKKFTEGTQAYDSNNQPYGSPKPDVTKTASVTWNGAYRVFTGALSEVPTTGEQIRTALVDTSTLGNPNTLSFNTGTENRILVVANANNRELVSAINDGTKEVLTFRLLDTVTTTPDAGGDAKATKVYVCEMAVPFLTNAKINLTFR